MQQFKVGDWVRIKSNNKVLQLPNHTSSTEVSCIEFGGQQYFLDDIELWQPKEGEWCWFWNNGQIVLARFSRIENDEFITLEIDMTGNCYYKYCEPFIGNLPSFLKEE